MKKKILIIGSSGYIGKKLSHYLNRYFSVYKLSRNIENENSKNIKCDISKKNLLKKKISKLPNFDFVINLSGQIQIDSNKMKEDIYLGNKYIIECFKNTKTKIILFSTTLVYGHSPNLISLRTKPKPQSKYAILKFKSEKLYHNKLTNFTILRIANIYDTKLTKKGLLKNLIDAIRNGKSVEINRMNSSRNYIHIEDLNRIVKKIILQSYTPKIINVCNENITNYRIVKIFENIFNKKISIKNLNKNRFQDPSLKFSVDEFIKKLNFEFRYNLISTIKKLYAK